MEHSGRKNTYHRYGRESQRVSGVKTTFSLNADSSEQLVGEGRIAFEMQWSETYRQPLPEQCEEVDFALRLHPALPPA